MTEEATEVKETNEAPKDDEKGNDLSAIMSKLDELGISSAEDLDKKARAAQEAGRIANHYGQAKAEIEELKSEIEALKKPATPDYSDDNYGVDIEAAISGAVEKALTKREQRQRQISEARAREIHKIQSDSNYKVFGKDFESYMGTPDARARIANGETATTIYKDIVVNGYRNMMAEMKGAYESSKGNPSNTDVPHMENTQTPPPHVEQSDIKKQKLKNLREKWVERDSDDNLADAIEALLPSGSIPI